MVNVLCSSGSRCNYIYHIVNGSNHYLSSGRIPHFAKKATFLVCIGVCVTGTISCFSPEFFNLLDYASAKLMLPIGGLFISLFVGWYLDQRLIMAQITNKGAIKYGMGFLKGYIFILRYVAPLAILAIFLYGLLS